MLLARYQIGGVFSALDDAPFLMNKSKSTVFWLWYNSVSDAILKQAEKNIRNRLKVFSVYADYESAKLFHRQSWYDTMLGLNAE